MNGRIKGFYTSLNSTRQTLLDRARFCSSLLKTR